MSRIVLTTIGSLGDLHPQIALGIKLRQRGHEVIFATMKEYGAIIELRELFPESSIQQYE